MLLLVLCLLNLRIFLVLGQCLVTLQQRFGEIDGLGLLQTSPKGDTFCSFLGIPYAQPPVGELRFEPPQPIDLSLYASLWDFTKPSPMCIQNSLFTNESFIGQEDCLYLNVYTKNTFWVNLRPVIVWIHEGFFNYGSAYSDGADRPDYLVDEDIVVVTLNYRLGALGFLYREGENIVGNNGLRDQIQALDWIQNNIEVFGGDPERVTLMGLGAGSASIAYHLQAPLSLGYFHGAIMLSGSSLNPWAYQRNTESCVQTLCRSLHIPCYRGYLKDILKTLPASAFAQSFNAATSVSYFGQPLPCFVPTTEIYEAPPGVAMVQDEQQQLTQHTILSDVPLMIGHTVAEHWNHVAFNRDSLRNEWNYSYSHATKELMESLRHFLISHTDDLNNYSKELLVKSLTENGVKEFVKYFAGEAISKTYFFRFSHKDPTNDIGSFHRDSVRFIFIKNNSDLYENYRDSVMRAKMVQYVSNFVKYGNPTPKLDEIITTRWTPYAHSALRMEISEESKMVRDVKDVTYKRWETIYQCLEYNDCKKFFKLTSER